MRIVLLGVLMLMGIHSVLCGGHEEETSVTELVTGHLNKAADLERPFAQEVGLPMPPSTPVAGTNSWREKLNRLPRESRLLEHIPGETWEWVEQLNENEDKVQRILGQPVSLSALVALAALRDPQVRSSYEALRATVQRLPQANYLNDLLVRYRSFLREINTAVGPQVHKEKPGELYPFPAGLTLRGQIAALQIELARIEYESVLRKRVNSVARDAYELKYVDTAIEITEENRALVAQMESVALAQLRVARASQADALRAQTMLDLLDDGLYSLEREREVIIARLCSSLLVRTPDSLVITDSELTAPKTDSSWLVDRAQVTSQLTASARKRLELLEASTRLVETSFPLASSPASRIDLNAGAEAGPSRSTQAAFPEKISVGPDAAPMGQKLAYLDELRLRLRELRERLKSTEAEVETQVRTAWARFEASQNNLLVRDESVVPKLERVFNTTIEQYNTDRATFFEFADTGRDYLDSLVSRERARFEHDLRLIDLQDSIGRTVLDLLSLGKKE